MNSLYLICLRKTTQLLMRNYWDVDMPENIFRAFPPPVIHALISEVCKNSVQALDCSHILLLLRSGRIIDFKLNDVRLDLSNAEEIFEALTPFSMRLKTIELMDISASFGYFIPFNFGPMLRSSTALISIESCIRFKLDDISNCHYLQNLVLDFDFADSISSFFFLPGVTPLNRTIRVLNIPRFQIHRYVYRDIAKILQYCAELEEIDHEVTRSIIYLHEQNAATRYKLLKTTLGNDTGATSDGIFLTAMYCPDLREVDVTPEDYTAIHSLSNFHNIATLTIHEPTLWDREYHAGLRPLLENSLFGHNLKKLTIINYRGVSFASIGTCCPNLVELKLELITEDNNSEIAPRSYKKLTSLYIENANQEPCKEKSLIGFLSDAAALEFLTIQNASMFNDSVLKTLLKNEAALSKLKTINIPSCALTLNGLRKLAKRLKSLTYLSLSSFVFERKDAEEILKPLNLSVFRWVDG